MRRFARLATTAAAAVCLAIVAVPGADAVASAVAARRSPAVISPHWTKISSGTGLGFASAGLLRTSDGRLHVVWPQDVGGSYSLHYSTVGPKAALLATGTIAGNWAAIDQFPGLVAGPAGGLRAIFDGANGQPGSPYNVGTFYSATASSAGTGWTLQPGSLSHSSNTPLTDNAATTESGGQPVTAWSSVASLSYHVGTDPSVPAARPDVQIPIGSSGALIDPTLVTSGNGTLWGAWFNSSGTATMGYWADQILTGASGMVKAPGSGGTNQSNNQPLQPVALATRAGGGEYLAYCVPTKTITCGHIALWRAGAATAMTVPGSASGGDGKVALAAAPGGHLWVLWFDFRSNVIQAVETNAAATAFGTVMTITQPPNPSTFQGLQAQASAGPLDIVALATQATASSPAFFAAQVG